MAATEPWHLVVSAIATLVGGFMRGFVGFGGALVSILVVSLLIGPKAAVAIAAMSGIPAMFQLLPAAIKYAERRFVVPFGLASIVCAPLGTLVLVTVDQALMKMAIAGFVLAMVSIIWRGWRFSAGGTLATAIAGAIAGFIQGAGGVGGPPAVTVALSRPGTAVQQRANTIGAVSGLNICAVGPLLYFGLITPQVILFACIMTPIYSAGTWYGTRYFGGKGQQHYRNSALILLAVIGVVTFGLSAQDYFAG